MNPSILNTQSDVFKIRSNYSISHDVLSYLLILLSILVAFYTAWDNTFVHWDDQYYVTQNMYVFNHSWDHLWVLLTKVVSLNYHPLTMVSLWINSYFFGVQSATPYILTNIAIHFLSACILYRFINLLTSEVITAITVALVFAIHPMHVESVVWVSERKDVLYALFFFSSLFYYNKFISDNSRRYWIISIILFLCSCLSKAMAVSLVPVLFLVDIYKNEKWWSLSSMLSKLPYTLVAFLFGCIAINVQSGGDFYGLLSNTNIEKAISIDATFTFVDKLSNAGYGLYFYIKNFFWPSEMSPFHPYASGYSLYTYFACVPLLLLLILIISFFRSKKVLFGLGLFMVTVALVLQFIPVGSAIVADRYTYLPYVGLAFLVGSILQILYTRRSVYLVAILSMAMTIGMSILTYHQSAKWQDHITLFSQAVERYPEDAKSRILLATGYWTAGEHHKAIEHIEYAINNLGLYNSDAFEKLANCYAEIGESQKALSFYNHSIELDSLNYISRYHRGLLLMDLDPTAALIDFDVAMSSGFEYIQSAVYGPRGVVHGKLGMYDEAIHDLTQAIDLGIDLSHNLRDRAVTYDLLGRPDLAATDRERLKSL